MPHQKRSPWITPVIVAVLAAGIFLAIVFTRSGIDLQHLLGEWFVHAALFIAVAAAAIVAYRSMRRARDPQAMDEARSIDSRH